MIIDLQMIHIWIGPKPAPKKWMNTWRTLHPDWNYWVFTDEMYQDTRFINQHLMDHYYQAGKFNGVADLIRYELLLTYGGFLPPADAVCKNPVDELLVSPSDHCYTVFENEQHRPGLVSPIYAANPENKFVQTIVETLSSLKATDLHPSPWRSTGNMFLKEMIKTHDPAITIWPSHYFIPNHFDPAIPSYNGTDKIFADQMWGSTSGGNEYSKGH